MKKFFITLLCLLLIIGAGLFAYKKIGIDSNGYYANSRLTYTRDYGFSMLITYYPNNQRGDAKGFAVTNIPVAALFSERELIQEYSKEKTDFAIWAPLASQIQLKIENENGDFSFYNMPPEIKRRDCFQGGRKESDGIFLFLPVFSSFERFFLAFSYRTVYSSCYQSCMGVSRFRLVALNVNCIPRMIVGLVNHRSIQ